MSGVDERRDLLVQACTFYCSHQMVSGVGELVGGDG